MKLKQKGSTAVDFGVAIAVLALAGLLVWGAVRNARHQDERQERINAFYHKHNCRPEGYVATKHTPIRTYRCDNGLFVTSDMID